MVEWHSTALKWLVVSDMVFESILTYRHKPGVDKEKLSLSFLVSTGATEKSLHPVYACGKILAQLLDIGIAVYKDMQIKHMQQTIVITGACLRNQITLRHYCTIICCVALESV